MQKITKMEEWKSGNGNKIFKTVKEKKKPETYFSDIFKAD